MHTDTNRLCGSFVNYDLQLLCESNPDSCQIEVSDSKYSAAARQGENFAPLIPDMKLQLCLQAKPK